MCWIVDRMMVVKFVGDEDDGRVTCIFEAKETPRRTNMAFCSFPRGFAFFLPANEISPKHIPENRIFKCAVNMGSFFRIMSNSCM